MNTNEKFVIAINRELGSGGRTVGAKLAEMLNVPFYDKALIQALEEKYHLSAEEIEKMKARKKSWWDDFDILTRPFVDYTQAEYLTHILKTEVTPTPENLYNVEKEILLGIADTGSCIIAGRTAFFVLKDHPNRLSVLIQAPLEHRIERVMQKQDLSREEAIKLINKVDTMRENYVNRYTGTSRYDTRNYDLVINMEGHTEESAAALILQYIKG